LIVLFYVFLGESMATEKLNAKTTIPLLLASLSPADRIVSIDTIGWRRLCV
jgi:hypothetical protein